MTKRVAPYLHTDGSNCWTKNCSLNHRNTTPAEQWATTTQTATLNPAATYGVTDPEVANYFNRWVKAGGHTDEPTTYYYGEYSEWSEEQSIEFIMARDAHAAIERRKRLAFAMEITPEELDEELDGLLQRTINEKDLIVRVSHTNILADILEAGEIIGLENYDEDYEDIHDRTLNERVWFGTHNLPIYGAFSDTDNEKLNQVYGEISIILDKSDLIPKTSITLGDSLNRVASGILPYPLQGGNKENLAGSLASNVAPHDIRYQEFLGQDSFTDKYLEAQIVVGRIPKRQIQSIHIGQHHNLMYDDYVMLKESGIPFTLDCEVYNEEGEIIPAHELS